MNKTSFRANIIFQSLDSLSVHKSSTVICAPAIVKGPGTLKYLQLPVALIRLVIWQPTHFRISIELTILVLKLSQ